MGRKNRYVSMDSKKRFRLTVELDGESQLALEAMLEAVEVYRPKTGLSAIVRASLLNTYRGRQWKGALFADLATERVQPVNQHILGEPIVRFGEQTQARKEETP